MIAILTRYDKVIILSSIYLSSRLEVNQKSWISMAVFRLFHPPAKEERCYMY